MASKNDDAECRGNSTDGSGTEVPSRWLWWGRWAVEGSSVWEPHPGVAELDLKATSRGVATLVALVVLAGCCCCLSEGYGAITEDFGARAEGAAGRILMGRKSRNLTTRQHYDLVRIRSGLGTRE